MTIYRPAGVLFAAMILLSAQAFSQTISFASSNLSGESLTNPTSLQFGPDGRLYVAQQNGLIRAYTVVRNSANNYQVTATETISSIQQIPNHNDNGAVNNSVTTRQVTGIFVTGTAANPVIYVSSSDPRIGGNSAGTDTNLDTNSGIISRLTKNGASWTKVDLVRGLPRSEENHSTNGMAISAASNLLYVAQGGHTNMGAPSNNFALTPEYAYSTAILRIDLNAIGSTTYNLPTLDDETRSNVGGAQAGYVDPDDPFGGNEGKNQAMLVAGGPVQIYSSGWRNHYDVLITQAGKMYSFDNGPNSGWGGTPSNCSNAVSEPGSANCDVLHNVTQGYYAGHPNPTRANRSNTFNSSNPQTPIPVGMENSIECTYQAPENRPGAIKEICTSSNGLAEYTASNFSNAMKGDLLATGFNGNLYRFKLNAGGTALVSGGFTTLASGFGTSPLDVIAQGDNAVFPGTIWICTYGSHNITILEPVDFAICTGDMNSFVIDLDGDGYSNGDETANGTNPCSAASKPSDFDLDFVSDLTDTDDDNDGISDTADKFARDSQNGTNRSIPYTLLFDNNNGGILGWGFTGLMTNGSNYASLYNADKMTVGGAALKFTVEEVTAGDPYQGANTQEYGFQLGVNAGAGPSSFIVHTRLSAPFAGVALSGQRSMGLFIGTGDQDNYLKIVTAANGGAGGIEVLKEVAGTATGNMHSVSITNKSYIDLYLSVNKSANEVQPMYSIEGGSQTALGSPIAVPASWLSGVLAAGFLSTSLGSGSTFPATWDLIEVKTSAPDCNGVAGGSAFIDDCGICSGGNTGHIANSDKDACGVCFGNGSSCGGTCVPNEVVSFTLVRAGTAGEIGPLTNGMTINIATIGSFSIRANTCNGQNVGSVKFILNGAAVKTESSAPYAINGDNNGNYFAWNPTTGAKTLTGTPYTGSSGSGTAGVSETVAFTVVNESTGTPDCNGVVGGTAFIDDCGVCSGGNTGHVANSDKDACGVCFGNGSSCGSACVPLQVTQLMLVHEGTAGDIGLLTEGMTIYLGSIGNFSVRADICAGSTAVKSVKFKLNGSTYKTESAAPYALNGDSPTGYYKKWSPSPGSYALVATPYSGTGGSGTAGIALTRNFTAVSGSAKTDFTEQPADDDNETLLVYPNPNSGEFNIELNVPEKQDLQLRIFNHLGQVFISEQHLQFEGEFKKHVSLEPYSSGMYYITLHCGDKILSGKIIAW